MNGGICARFIVSGENRFVLVEGDENVADLQVELVGPAADGQGTAHEMKRARIGGAGGERIALSVVKTSKSMTEEKSPSVDWA